ncbi:MAG: hypothetical protein M1822_003174 [Bathelium mastoideum]|nr:MAG: hypothetical protein M1822_003174 [Bathelium mastoideum]
MVPLRLEEVDITRDFPELISCEWESYEQPHQNFFRLFCPIFGSREESLKECTERQLEWHTSDPTSYWQKVTDTNTNRIIAGALWKIYPTNPFGSAAHEEAYWYPQGGQRDYVTAALERFEAPRARLAPKPQLYLNIIFVHPKYRWQGAANMIMDWGIAKAAEMNVDIWLDATVHGIPLYKKYGFEVMFENDVCPETKDPSEEWQAIDKELRPMTMWVMRKPTAGTTTL